MGCTFSLRISLNVSAAALVSPILANRSMAIEYI